jgi:hypothetical protein
MSRETRCAAPAAEALQLLSEAHAFFELLGYITYDRSNPFHRAFVIDERDDRKGD